jgi:hypothetical protein
MTEAYDNLLNSKTVQAQIEISVLLESSHIYHELMTYTIEIVHFWYYSSVFSGIYPSYCIIYSSEICEWFRVDQYGSSVHIYIRSGRLGQREMFYNCTQGCIPVPDRASTQDYAFLWKNTTENKNEVVKTDVE